MHKDDGEILTLSEQILLILKGLLICNFFV